jgi:lipopolysaccharide transport system ATP-binding protein
MSRLALRIEGLGKQYWLNHQGRQYKALRDVLTDAASWPITAMRSLVSRRNGRSGEEHGKKERFWALRDVSFDVHQGEVIGVIGRNGAGKSTLLKVVSRITEPTTGRAEVYGRVGSLLEVGTGFHPELSGRENIYMNGSILGMRRAEIDRKFDDIVAFAEVDKFVDTPVKRYSSGMYTRLAFAVAAHLEPEVLFIDEVLAVGDAGFQRKCLGKMGEMSRNGRTVLFVSHNMTAIQSLCTRTVWLKGGQVEAIGDTRSVVGKYLQTAALSASEMSWESPKDAPGNDRVRLHRVAVIPKNNAVSTPITVETAFDIEVEYWNFTPGATLNASIELYNIEEVCVFNSFSIPTVYPSGLLRAVCEVPAQLLNNSLYRVRLFIVRDASEHLVTFDSIMFEVHDVERAVAYYGRWVGAVRPMLKWRTEVMSSADVGMAIL